MAIALGSIQSAQITGPNDNRGLFIDYICEHRNDYYRLAYSFMGQEADAMDAVSQMTVVVLEKYHTLREETSFPAWSKKILVNICRDKLKDKKRIQPLELPVDQAYEDPKNVEDEVLVRNAINALPEKYREVLVLRYYLDYEYQDIAKALDLPDGTVKSRLYRGMAALKEILKGEYHEQ